MIHTVLYNFVILARSPFTAFTYERQ